MQSQKSDVAHLVSQLSDSLGGEYTVLPAGFYAAIIHQQFGLATVVPSDSEEVAKKASVELQSLAKATGLDTEVAYFGISSTTVSPPWLVRSGPGMIIDIVTTLVKLGVGRPPMSMEILLKIISSVGSAAAKANEQIVKVAEASNEQLSPYINNLAKVSIEKALGDSVPYLADVPIDSSDMAAPNFMLPALLTCSALTWTFPVVAKKGKGGFVVKLIQDEKAVLGYRVTGVDVSAPVLLFLPMINLIRRACHNGRCDMDQTVQRFSDYLDINGFNNDILGDVDIKAS